MDNTSYDALFRQRFSNGRRKIGNNTYAFKMREQMENGDDYFWFKITYHGNTIARISDVLIWVSDCGWNIVTTRQRIHQVLTDNKTGFFWNSKGCFRNMYPFSQSWDMNNYQVTVYRSNIHVAVFDKPRNEFWEAVK